MGLWGLPVFISQIKEKDPQDLMQGTLKFRPGCIAYLPSAKKMHVMEKKPFPAVLDVKPGQGDHLATEITRTVRAKEHLYTLK